MIIDFSKILLTATGENLLHEEDKTPVPLYEMCVGSLFVEESDPLVKEKKWELSKKISKGGEVELSNDEFVMLKKAAEKLQTQYFGAVNDALK